MKNISTALVAAQRAFGPALKTATNPHLKTKYANLSACIEAVIDALNSNGIFLMQKTHEENANGVTVETIFLHESGESMSSGPLFVPAQKQDPQGYGSALTYARRYSLMTACGIAPEDDDGHAASQPKHQKTAQQPAVQQVEQPVDHISELARKVEKAMQKDPSEAAKRLAAMEKPVLDAVWTLLAVNTQQILNNNWPK